MGIKLDISKVDDRMEWGFQCKTLEAFGFDQEFIQIIRECMGSVSYSILLNGSSFGNIVLSRGLRQGDPITSCLLFLGAEVLSRLFIKV